MIGTSCLPRKVEINGEEFTLAPPLVGQAVTLLQLFEQADFDDPEDQQLLSEAIIDLDWSPCMRLRGGLILNMIRKDRLTLQATMGAVIMQGFTPKESEKNKSGKVDWFRMIDRYRQVFGGSLWQVWNEVPFPFLLESLKELRASRAEQLLDLATASNPSKKSIESLQKDLVGSKPEPSKFDLMMENLSPEEVEKVKESARKKYMNGNS